MRDTPLSPDEVRAAAEVYQELGPQYRDAVVESFLDKIDQEIATRIDAHLASLPEARRRKPKPARLALRRAFLGGAAIGAISAGVPLTLFTWGIAGAKWLVGTGIAVWAVFVAAKIVASAVRAPQFRGDD